LINPLLISKGLKVKKFLEKNQINFQEKATFIEEKKDGTGFVLVFEFAFPTLKEAEMFRNLYELAEELQA